MSPRRSNSRSRRFPTFDLSKMLKASAPVAVSLFASLWLAGCDTPANQEDHKVQAQVADAQNALARGDDAGLAAATKMLEQAAANADATPLTRSYAKSSLGQIEQDTASQTMRQIDQDDASLHQLIWEISQLAQQVDQSRAVAASYDKYDPKPAQDALAAKIAAAQGGPNDLVWFKQDNSSAPSLAAVTQTISQLQSQLAKQSDDLKALKDQRTQVLDEADQADKSSEISKGQQSVDDFKRAADLRKQAGDLTVQIEKNQAQTIPIQKDLEVAQGQQVVLQELIKEFQDQGKSLDAGWKSVQDAVASQAVLQKQIVAGGPETAPAPAPAAAAPAGTPDAGAPAAGVPAATSILPPTAGQSINDKADALGKLIEQISHERSDALANLNNAIQHYRDAATAGQEYFAILDPKIKDPANAQRPEIDAWKNLQAVANPAVYRMQEALARRQLAELYLSQVDNDDRLTQLQDEVGKILGAVNIHIPSALSDAGLDQDKKSAADSAAAAYKDADDEIDSLTHSAAPDPLPKLARVQHVLILLGELQLALATGDSSTAHDKLTQAITERDDALRDGLQLPPLPSEILPPPPPAPTPAPAT